MKYNDNTVVCTASALRLLTYSCILLQDIMVFAKILHPGAFEEDAALDWYTDEIAYLVMLPVMLYFVGSLAIAGTGRNRGDELMYVMAAAGLLCVTPLACFLADTESNSDDISNGALLALFAGTIAFVFALGGLIAPIMFKNDLDKLRQHEPLPQNPTGTQFFSDVCGLTTMSLKYREPTVWHSARND